MGRDDRLRHGLLAGAAAGAAGTTALNVVTYLDMATRGRASSNAPEDSAERLAEKAGITIPGEGETRDNRLAGLGPLLGVATGVGIGALAGAVLGGMRWRPPVSVLSVALGAAAMAGTDAPMALLGVTSPSSWKPADWAADVVPHLAYGAVTAAVVSSLLPAARGGGDRRPVRAALDRIRTSSDLVADARRRHSIA